MLLLDSMFIVIYLPMAQNGLPVWYFENGQTI